MMSVSIALATLAPSFRVSTMSTDGCESEVFGLAKVEGDGRLADPAGDQVVRVLLSIPEARGYFYPIVDLIVPKQLAQYATRAAAITNDPANGQARYGPDATVAARVSVLTQLEHFGLFELDLIGEPGDLLIAGSVLRALGRAGIALPLAALVTGRSAGLPGPLHAIRSADAAVLIDGADLGLPAFTIDLDGVLCAAELHPAAVATRALARFAAPATLTRLDLPDGHWWALHEILSAHIVLGVVEQAVTLSRSHLNEREQFGRQLKSFQSLAHRFADMVVRREGLTELCLYTSWAYYARPHTALVDALALRLYALDTLTQAVRDAHQIHAAMGFCHEHPLADLTASGWLLRTQPLTVSQTADALASRADEFEMLFSDE